MVGIRRREFLTLVGGTAAAWPLAAPAQQATVPVIGYLSGQDAGSYAPPEFHQGLSQAGYIEGRNVAIEYHWAGVQFTQLPALAEDLVRRQVSVIVAVGFPASVAAKARTTTIPIVFTVGVDPVRAGLINSLNRPGGNLTGVTSLAQELEAKRLEVLHEAVPAITSVAALFDPAEPAGGTRVNAINHQEAARGGVGHHDRHHHTAPAGVHVRGSAPSFVAGMLRYRTPAWPPTAGLRQAVAAIGGQRITSATAVPQ
jgi:putative tryptophan/tyrosine transport system substrate-binding protein